MTIIYNHNDIGSNTNNTEIIRIIQYTENKKQYACQHILFLQSPSHIHVSFKAHIYKVLTSTTVVQFEQCACLGGRPLQTPWRPLYTRGDPCCSAASVRLATSTDIAGAVSEYSPVRPHFDGRVLAVWALLRCYYTARGPGPALQNTG